MSPRPALLLSLALALPAAGAEEEAPALAKPPVLKALVPADVPPGTAFPAPEVAVVLSIDVAAAGRVTDVAIQQGAGEPFDAAALAAARKFEFEPGRLATGEAVPVTVNFRMRIQQPAAPPPPPVRLAGRLLERGTRVPLADVPILIRTDERALARADTDMEGRFAVEVPETEFSVVASPPGHQRLDALVKAQPGTLRTETYYLESTGNPNETVVSATPVLREVLKDVLTAKQVEQSPGTAGDTLKAVLNLPGAARPPGFTGLVILRGSAPQDSQVFLEGQQIPILYHFGGIRSTIAPAFLQSVEFVPGNFSTDYGRAQGGIIDVRVRDPRSDAFHGEADVNLYDIGVSMEGGLGKGWSIGGAFRRSWIDSILPLVLPNDAQFSFNTAPRFYDYQFITAYRPDPSHHLRLMFYGSMDRLVAIFERPQTDPTITGTLDARISFHNLQADYQSILSPTLRQETSLQIGLQEIVTQLGPQYFFDLKDRRLSLRSTFTLDLASGVDLRAGADVRLDGARVGLNLPQNRGQNPVPISTLPQIGTVQDITLFAPAAFLELRWAPIPSLSFLPGLRMDWYSLISRWTFDPRLLARWEVVPGTVLKGGVGLYQQPPQPGEANAAIGTPDLLAERSLQVSLGVAQRFVEGISLEVTGFYKWLDQQVIPNPASNYDPAAPRYTNEGTGRVYGIETLLRAMIGDRFSGFLAYTFSRSLRTDPPGGERPFAFDQPSNLTVLGSYLIGRGWTAGLRFRLVSGNPSTPVTSSVYDAATGVYVPIYGPTHSERLSDFWALDVRIAKQWVFDTWRLELYLDTQNVTNRANQEGWTYSFDYAERTPATGLPILPILGIRGEW